MAPVDGGMPSRPTLRPPTPTRPPASSLQPSPRPPLVSDQVVQVNYEIGLRNGNDGVVPPNQYIPSLIAAMDILAVSVEESWNANQLMIETQEAAEQAQGNQENANDADESNDSDVDIADPSFSRIGDDDNRNLRRSAAAAAFVQASELLDDMDQQQEHQQQRRRRLAMAVEVDLPSEISGTIDEACPDFVPATDKCRNIASSIPLIVYLTGEHATEESAAAVKALFELDLGAAIEDGRLQDALYEVDPDSVVYVTTGATEVPPVLDDDTLPTSPPDEKSDGLNAGAIAGITVGCAAVVILAGVLLTRKKNTSRVDDDDEELLKDADDRATTEQLSKDIAAADAKYYQDEPGPDPAKAAMVGGAVGATAAVAATRSSSTRDSSQKDDYLIAPTSSSSPGKKKRFSSGALYQVPGAKNITSDEGSSAGESGWSSNQDMSSIDSKSLDSGAGQMHIGGGIGGAAALAGAAAAAAGVAAMNSSDTSSRGGTNEDASYTASRDYSAEASLNSTYSELDDAIQKGDWAAVGVTAALLASQSHDDGSTHGSKPRGLDKDASLNPQRAAELDALVEAGDWEGVVAAAARFDAQEALRGESTTASGAGSGSNRSRDSPSGAASTGGSSIASGTLESTTSPSTFTAAGNTATSDTASTRSKARKLNEIREEVEGLVNAVVPEEADNVDEMMTQFRGREEELVETLRSMQERQVAQKARLESQKQAKRTAKAFVETQKQQQTFDAVDNTGGSADEQWMADLETPDGAPKEEDVKKQLKEAIEKEDWNNVAEAAAGLSGHGIFHDDDETSGSRDVASTEDINALVDRGDWDGVVAAASRAAGASQKTDSTTSVEERRRKRQERLKEEEEALAQAEIWDAIAEQTKAEDKEEEDKASNAGANMAAAWAIDRSLTALRRAETDKSENSTSERTDDGGEEV
ncbi:MAG: hypothetical protein SGARI_000531 [Bacillariaceae sp.]